MMAGLRGGKRRVYVCMTDFFKTGDPPPADHDYVHWHEWADVQGSGGLKQAQCEHGRWLFPQESCARHLTLDTERQQSRLAL